MYAIIASTILLMASLIEPNKYLIIASLVLISAAIYFSLKTSTAIKKLIEIGAKVKAGDFESRIVLLGEKGSLPELAKAINTIIDASDAYVRESKATLLAAADEKYYRKVVLTGMQGTYLQAAETLNSGMAAIRNNLMKVVQRAAKKLEESVKKSP